MSNIIDFNEKKTIEEWKTFAEKQFLTIQFLQGANAQLQKELNELKTPQKYPIERIIVSPEQALLDDQISMIQQRALLKELNLEDVKKLDLLIKNKRLLTEDQKTLEGKSKKIQLSSDELLKIAQDTGNGQ